jgi:Regulator of chromosome condensation (RCC1) repeat
MEPTAGQLRGCIHGGRPGEGLDPTGAMRACCLSIGRLAQVAVGVRHAALITRSGELYTWGEGTGGKLGRGNQSASENPERVPTLWGKTVRHVAARCAAHASQGTPWMVVVLPSMACSFLAASTRRLGSEAAWTKCAV